MGTSELRVALIVPNIDAYSGAVERTVKVIEHSTAANLRYTAFLPKEGASNAELGRDLERLARSDRLELRTLASGSSWTDESRFDAIAIPTEYWWGPWKRGRASGLKGTYCLEFHLLPYVGTLDLLKSAGVSTPRLKSLAMLPLLLHQRYGEGLSASVYNTIACAATVRGLSSVETPRILAISKAIARHMRSMGHRGHLYVPDCPNGIEPEEVRKARTNDDPVLYDGIFVGRFHPQKGFFDVPFLAAHLRSRLRRDVRIAVCGGSDAPGQREKFDAMVRRLGVENNVEVLGRIPKRDLYTAMRQSRALLYPSYVDGFPITVLESLCLGVPVIGYDTDALALSWGDEKALFRTPVGDPETLAELYSTLDKDGRLDRAREEARAHSERLLEAHTWAKVVHDQRIFFEGGGAAA